MCRKESVTTTIKPLAMATKLKQCILVAITLIALNTVSAHVTMDSLLSNKEKSIISIAALTAKGDLNRLQKEIVVGLESGLTINQIKEIQVHSYAYCGFPRSIRGLQTLMQVVDERKSKGILDPMGNEAMPIKDTLSKYDRGRITLGKLTNSNQTRPSTGYGAFAPVIDVFLKEHLFADIFDRDVLTYTEREWVTISVISSIGNAEPMLKSHYGICLNLGISSEKLYAFTAIIKMQLGDEAYVSSRKTLDELLNKQTIASFPTSSNTVFPKGEIVKSGNFTGTAWLYPLFSNDTTYNIYAGSVRFEPNARTHWHYHPGGQILLVLSGTGLYQEKGKPMKKIQKGDVIQCPPNVEHWHGASPESELTHVAIGTNPGKGPVVWLTPVTDKEYAGK
jgi:quercetin dioxygenase-like cupin family protein/alkylhydroperoxidase/carboxymuconolactone decarboxylase family protein YurZ